MSRKHFIVATALVVVALASIAVVESGLVVAGTFRMLLWGMACGMLWWSVFLFRQPPVAPLEWARTLARFYTATATLVFTSAVLFVFLNLALEVALKIAVWHDPRLAVPQFKKYGDRVYEAYADVARKDVESMLIEAFQRPAVYESFTQFRERPFTGRFVNVLPAGFRDSKSGAPWPPVPGNLNVFVFGGSTTFGYGVPDDETIPAHLQRVLDGAGLQRRAVVYNFGAGFYFSTQERILFEKLLLDGVRPDVVIFIDGLNDIGHPEGVGWWTDALREMMEGRVASTEFFLADSRRIIENLPILRLLRNAVRPVRATSARARGAATAGGSQQPTNAGKGGEALAGAALHAGEADNYVAPVTPGAVSAEVILDRYTTNQRMIREIARNFGIRTVFVWQPIPSYKYDLRLHPFQDGVSAPGSPEQREYETVYKLMARRLKAERPAADFLWLADLQEVCNLNLYVDSVHYTPAFSAEIARHIFEHIERRSLLPA